LHERTWHTDLPTIVRSGSGGWRGGKLSSVGKKVRCASWKLIFRRPFQRRALVWK